MLTAAISLSACGGIANTGTPPASSFTASSTNVQFGTSMLETPVNIKISLANSSASSVVVSHVTASGASFSVNSLAALPLTVSAGGTATFNVQFDASVAGAVTGQVAVASNSPSNPAITIQLSGTGTAAGTPPAVAAGLKVNSSTVAFGSIEVGVPSTQALTLTSTGTGPVIVSADSLTGTGFTASGITLPLTIASGQTATLNLQFDPTAAGAATSSLTITSNATASSTTVVALSGTGVRMQTDLAWDAPAAGADLVTGYNIYRATGSSSAYAKLNSAINAPVSFADSTIAAGATYNYYVTSVDSSGNESVPSNTATVVVP